MVHVSPFPALRPRPELAAAVSAPPYDVVSTAEAHTLAAGNPLSFLHVSRPEIDLPPQTDPYSQTVYDQGAKRFQEMLASGALRQDSTPAFYFYRQVLGPHTQTGLVAVADCADYENGVIKKHELTQPSKEDDRTRHIEALDAQTGPAFLVYKAVGAIDAFVTQRTAADPDIDFTAADGVRHQTWLIADPEGIDFMLHQFLTVPAIYIADGHHRTAAAARVCRMRNGIGSSTKFLAVIFADRDVQILPYHRMVRDLNGLTTAAFQMKLSEVLEQSGNGQPAAPHEVAIYLEGQWRRLRFRESLTRGLSLEERLDVALLQRYVLGPILGIENPRTSQRLACVGGLQAIAELEKRVNAGWACAIAMHPTTVNDLMAVADANRLMPPKSTWFEPKLRDGLFCHRLQAASR